MIFASRDGDGGGQVTPAQGDAYAPRRLAPGTTSPESGDGKASAGQPLAISLSDGSRIEVPASEGAISASLARETTSVDLSVSGVEPSGATRVFSFEAPAAPFVPTITIPASEAGEADPRTLGIARIGPLVVDGAVAEDQVVVLPVTKDAKGNLVARDTAMAQAPLRDGDGALLVANVTDTNPIAVASLAGQVKFHNQVKYVVSTFQGNLNWSMEPRLVRMVPDAKGAEGRHPLPANPTADADKQELLKPVVNVVILVHGHNEEERAGFEAKTAAEPWLVPYKRDVWTNFYTTFASEYPEELGCTAFYEFVYPTFRPIFTPGNGETLMQSFARLVEADPELKALAGEKAKFNLFVVAHSMGGLVARGGLRLLNDELKSDFQQLVTWGTPHHGSPLVTLRYALGAVPGYETRPGGTRIPTGNLSMIQAYQSALSGQQLDTPGTRDLRWDNGMASTPRLLTLSDVLLESADQIAVNEKLDIYDARSGSWLYNANLQTFNETDPWRLSDKYTFLYGVTSKRADIQQVGVLWKVWRFARASAVAQGATLMPYLVANADTAQPLYGGLTESATDGAVPLMSMVGVGIAQPQRTVYLGDIDHEEYFGSPADGVFAAPDKARTTAIETLKALGIGQPRCKCPVIEVTKPPSATIATGAAKLEIEAKLTWPAELDQAPGIRVRDVQALLVDPKTKAETVLGKLDVGAGGAISGSVDVPAGGTGERQLVVRAQLFDKTEVRSAPGASVQRWKWIHVDIVVPARHAATGPYSPESESTAWCASGPGGPSPTQWTPLTWTGPTTFQTMAGNTRIEGVVTPGEVKYGSSGDQLLTGTISLSMTHESTDQYNDGSCTIQIKDLPPLKPVTTMEYRADGAAVQGYLTIERLVDHRFPIVRISWGNPETSRAYISVEVHE